MSRALEVRGEANDRRGVLSMGAQFLVALVCQISFVVMYEQPRRRCESSMCRRSRRSSARARRLRAPSSPSPAPTAPRCRAPHRRTRLNLIRPAQLCNVSIDVCGAAVYFVLVRREDLHRIVRLMPPRRVTRVVLRPVQRGLVLDARAPRRDSLAHRPPLRIHRRSLRCSSKTKHDVSTSNCPYVRK